MWCSGDAFCCIVKSSEKSHVSLMAFWIKPFRHILNVVNFSLRFNKFDRHFGSVWGKGLWWYWWIAQFRIINKNLINKWGSDWKRDFISMGRVVRFGCVTLLELQSINLIIQSIKWSMGIFNDMSIAVLSWLYVQEWYNSNSKHCFWHSILQYNTVVEKSMETFVKKWKNAHNSFQSCFHSLNLCLF